MNIFRTFDLFLSLPEKLFGKNFFKVCHIDTGSVEDSSVQAEVSDNAVQLNVYNNQKVYSLLTSVLYKKKLLNENKIGKIYQERTVA